MHEDPGAQVERALEALTDLGGPEVATAADELLAAVTSFYGEVLGRIVRRLAEQGRDGCAGVLEELAQDEVVASALLVHDLHPVPLASRVSTALDEIGRRLGVAPATIEAVDEARRTALVEIHPVGPGAGSRGALAHAVRAAVRGAVPDLDDVDVHVVEVGTPVTLRRGPRREDAGGLTRPRPAESAGCELCGAALEAGHRHVADLEHSVLRCTCRACALLFSQEGAARGRYRLVSDRYLRLPTGTIPPALWARLGIPVDVAFFLSGAEGGRVAAFYPGPAGAVESELPLGAWEEAVDASAQLGSVAPGVEAVLARVTSVGIEAFVVPVDACYELVGRLRSAWQGVAGGEEAAGLLDEVFADLGARARPLVELSGG